MMNESYDKINETRSHLGQIVTDIFRDRFSQLPVSCPFPEDEKVDQLKLCLEIDQFVREYPDNTYKKYLQELLNNYLSLQESVNKYVFKFIPNHDERDQYYYPYSIFELFSAIDFITEHLKGLLNPEPEIQETPQKFEKSKQKKDLSHRQIALIYQFEKKGITESNAESILIEFGKNISPTSNKALANTFRRFSTPNQRTGQGVNTANDICTILPFLNETAKQKALSELEAAKVNQNKIKQE